MPRDTSGGGRASKRAKRSEEEVGFEVDSEEAEEEDDLDSVGGGDGDQVYVVCYASWQVDEGQGEDGDEGEGGEDEPEFEVVKVFRDLEQANRAAEEVLRVTKFGDDTDWEDFSSEWGEDGMAVCEGHLRISSGGKQGRVVEYHRAWVAASDLQ